MKFSQQSKDVLSTCCNELQQVCDLAITLCLIDFSAVCGHRGQEEQTEYYNTGKSKIMWPHSKHNSIPSLAVDLVPWVRGKSSYRKEHCCYLAGVVMGVASLAGIKIRWGGNWNMDGEPVTDQDFQDLVHFEVM
jgi:peptidoglycan L-alanyl-D-glutamate endopeptidase CwlK